MVHYTCDQCGRDIDPESELRYEVKIESCAALEPQCDDPQDDRDHLAELHRAFEKSRDNALDGRPEDLTPRELRFDLCCDCHQKFVRNPLAKDVATQLDFSQN